MKIRRWDFLDYKIPTAVEMPPRIESIFIESDGPTGPFGAKNLSEPCCTVPAPAIANAIYNAVGAPATAAKFHLGGRQKMMAAAVAVAIALALFYFLSR